VISIDSIDYINYICLKFGATSITIKKEPEWSGSILLVRNYSVDNNIAVIVYKV
jgi:hypothetical protein